MEPRRPAVLLVVCALVLGEAVAVAALGVAWLVDLARGGTEIPGAVVFLVVCCAGLAWLLVSAVRAVLRGRRWGRSLLLTVQIFLVLMALGWMSVGGTPWSVGAIVWGVATGVGLLTPPVVAFTGGPSDGGAADAAGSSR
ncbi:hypothetical protein IC607_15690 [Cellulomonas sp. JH27-2]|uniref:hypothetical protein n=1 Tax=Cellulomonas sp. JH27-2 TaxID=2774139 RepID=UPI001782A636|nr:hypothetical protein [Cellulomonas sp. JH27-2]